MTIETGNTDTETKSTETIQTETGQTETQDTTITGGATSSTQTEETTAESQGAPEAYDFTESIPEGGELSETEANSFGEVCRELNLTNEQANKLAQYGFGYAGRIGEAAQTMRAEEVKQWGETAKQELGTDFDKTVQLCGVGVEAMERNYPGIRNALNETGAGNRIEIIKAFADMGRMMQEDPGAVGSRSKTADTNSYPNTDWDQYK